MFRSTARNLRSWWGDFSDDILGADLPLSPDDTAPTPLDYHLDHAHRRPLATPRLRRDGAVLPRPPHCVSPVRGTAPSGSAAAGAPSQISR